MVLWIMNVVLNIKENGKCNLMDGKGKRKKIWFSLFSYSDNASYQGYWINDKKDGFGKMILSNGDIYEGMWKGNLMDGKGNYYFNNGDKLQSIWIKGKYLNICKGIYLYDNSK